MGPCIHVAMDTPLCFRARRYRRSELSHDHSDAGHGHGPRLAASGLELRLRAYCMEARAPCAALQNAVGEQP